MVLADRFAHRAFCGRPQSFLFRCQLQRRLDGGETGLELRHVTGIVDRTRCAWLAERTAARACALPRGLRWLRSRTARHLRSRCLRKGQRAQHQHSWNSRRVQENLQENLSRLH